MESKLKNTIKKTIKSLFLIILFIANSYSLFASDSLYVNGNLKNYGSIINNGNILISGNLNNSGDFSSGDFSSIRFWGNTTEQFITNNSALTFHNAAIDNTGNVSLSAGNILITGTFTLKHGIFFTTENNIVDLGLIGNISENGTHPTSYVVGKVRATRDIGNSSNITFGGIGLEINEQTPSASYSTTVTRTTGTSCTNGTRKGIKRFYDIVPPTGHNTGLNATIKFHYFDYEYNTVVNGSNAISEENMIFFKSTDYGVTWSAQLPTPYTSNSLAENWYSKSGISSFSEWTLGDKDLPLPIELLSFSSFCENNNIKLKWATASETNNDYFTIERAENNNVLNFISLGTVNGAGNSNSMIFYQFADNNFESEKCNDAYTPFYYRLKQTDFDGTSTYSNIIPANCCGNSKIPILSPNPSDGIINGYVYDDASEVNVVITNAFGQKVLAKKYLMNHTNTFLIDATSMGNGTYIINLEINSMVYTYRQIILKNK